MRWRVFLADGTEIPSSEEIWERLPREGIVVAVWWDDSGQRHLECGQDALVNTGEEIVGVNLPTPLFLHAAQQEADIGRLKFGQLLDPHQWAEVRAEADEARLVPER